MLRTVIAAAAIALIPTIALALTPGRGPAAPSTVIPAYQGVDPCYKRCVLDAKGMSSVRKNRCRRTCDANPRKQCNDRCWLKNGNDPKGLRTCLRRCS